MQYFRKNKKGEEKIVFRNSWVTDIVTSSENITTLGIGDF
jgi:hypothetical protein